MKNGLMACAAEFSAASDGVDGFVVYEGKVFEAGSYPDKDFVIDLDELEAKASAFAGVDLDLEHSNFKEILGNKLGRLEAIWSRGAEAIGRLRVPRWLHELAGGRLQTSLSFDTDKNIVGCALTLNPRIQDAEVFAAFTIADGVAHPTPLTRKEKPTMPTSLKERLRVLFGKAPEALQEAGIDPAELDRVEFSDRQPQIDPAIQAQLTEFKATNDRLVAGQLNVAAALFADEVLRSAKAVPAQRDQLTSLYKTAAQADGQGVVRFSDSGCVEEGPNLTALRDLFKNAQPHTLFTTQIPNADPNAAVTTVDQAVVERLRSATSLGQQTARKEAK